MYLKNLLLFLGMILALSLQAQQNISGKMSPAADFKWLLVYKLNPAEPSYIADTAIRDGSFELVIPENSPAGMYRIVYAIPQEEFHFDIIYNGKEDIELSFDLDRGLEFQSAGENKIYHDYLSEVKKLEQNILQQYARNDPDAKLLQDYFKQRSETQKSFEIKSKGLISEHLIKANSTYIPAKYETAKEYLANKKKHYFDALDINQSILKESGFLSDKVISYVFNTFPDEPLASAKLESDLQGNIAHVSEVIAPLDDVYKTRIMNDLWNTAMKNDLNNTADFIFDNHLQDLATKTGNNDLIQKINTHNRLRIGVIAPEIEWEKEDTPQKLSALNGAENYVLVFWSSECSHCLNQLPKLQQGMQAFTNTKVVAIGLEEDKDNWRREADKLPNFMHGIALGKWNSPYVITYDIKQTPTYFVLDTDKRIVAKPDSYEDVVGFLEGKL